MLMKEVYDLNDKKYIIYENSGYRILITKFVILLHTYSTRCESFGVHGI